MPATSKDFEQLPETWPGGSVFKFTWPLIARAVRGVYSLWRNKIIGGTEPDDYIVGFYLSSGSNRKAYKIELTGTDLIIAKNTGSESVPIWVNKFTLNQSTDLITTAADVTVGDDLIVTDALTVGGNASIVGTLNVPTVTGWLHASAHQPGGADAIPTGTAVDVASANAAGTASSLARSDHAHKGVASLDVAASGTPIVGAANLQQSGLASVAKAGQNVTVGAQLSAPVEAKNIASQTEASVNEVLLTSLSNLTLTGANSTKKFLVIAKVTIDNLAGAANTVTVRLRVGPNGTTADTSIAESSLIHAIAAAAGDKLIHTLITVITPTSGDKISLSMQGTQAAGQQALGSAVEFCTLYVYYYGN